MFSVNEILWLFFVYSFLGWMFETVIATVKQKKFVNRGLISGPFCIIYGVAATIISVGLKDVSGIWLLLFSMIYATVVEWIGGHLIERLFGERWWDYSRIRYNLDGYICLPMSALWGLSGYIIVKFGNGCIIQVLNVLPHIFRYVIVLFLLCIMVIDILASYILLTGKTKDQKKWNSTNSQIASVSEKIERWIALKIQKRIDNAYPSKQKQNIPNKILSRFTEDDSFYKIVLLFFIGALLGDVIETIFCRITAGVWMSRSSVVWGPFSIVWGLAIALATAMLFKYRNREDRFLFFIGTALGGAYEYLCSVFTEIVFGKVFWDYSHMPFNLGGRVNLLYCFFWGIAAVIWFKKLFPAVLKIIEMIPKQIGKIVTWLLIVFMCCNVVISYMALVRYQERDKNIQAENAIEIWLDQSYSDEKMEKIYPNAMTID